MDHPTIIDIARMADVSKKTVSRVINNSPLVAKETREKVERIIAETGFVPNPTARELALALKRNFLVALVHDDPLAPVLADVQAGMLAALRDSEYALCVHFLDCDSRTMPHRLGDFIIHHRPYSILLMPPLSERDELAGLAWEYGCRCARLGATPQSNGPDWISTPDRQAAAFAVNHLVEGGHRRIAFIGGREDRRAEQQRELGYLDAMAEHELDQGPSLIASGDGSFESGIAAAQLLLELSPRPTAIFACSDEMAAGAIHAAFAKGIAIPAELAVIGFGDTLIASQVWPPLTTVRVPLMEMAHAAVTQLIDPECEEPASWTFPAALIERASHAPVQANTEALISSAFQSG